MTGFSLGGSQCRLSGLNGIDLELVRNAWSTKYTSCQILILHELLVLVLIPIDYLFEWIARVGSFLTTTNNRRLVS